MPDDSHADREADVPLRASLGRTEGEASRVTTVRALGATVDTGCGGTTLALGRRT